MMPPRKQRPPRKQQSVPDRLTGNDTAKIGQLLAVVRDLAERVARLEADADESLEATDRLVEVRRVARELRGRAS